ncbi:MAG: transporter substrate-binding domain-containing protein [Synergistaceae bacterium]|nr:transporter substrate-binding domain-containing protein [Synergistaceae bacterium]MBR0094399.1 transporter substrate-binding domain-containing protein [Synergistaceae bacterium]
MKKFLCLIVAFCLISCAVAFANDDDCVGFLTRLKTTPEEFFMLMKRAWATNGWAIVGDHADSKAKFYDSLMLMQMALNSGEIDEMILPDFVAEYLVKVNKSYSPCCISNSGPMYLCFGFLKENRKFADRWNDALIAMISDYTLAGLSQKYIKNFPEDTSYDYIYGINRDKQKYKDAIKFERFDGAPTVRVAVTGDLPPVDFVAENGMAAGYSTAVLAEIGKRLKVNIQLVQVNAGARTAALVSGRVDAVFWYEVNKSLDSQPDVHEDIILSEPYLSWDTFIHVKFAED